MRVAHRDGVLQVSELSLSTLSNAIEGGPDVGWLREAQQGAAAELDGTALVRAVPAAA